MAKCWNDNCNKDPERSSSQIFVGLDGDSVCNRHCEKEYNKQKAHFFNDIVHSAEKTEDWLMGKIS